MFQIGQISISKVQSAFTNFGKFYKIEKNTSHEYK